MWVPLVSAHNSQRPSPGSREGVSPSEEHLQAASLWTVCCSACFLYGEDSSLGLCSGSQAVSIMNASLSRYTHSSYNSLLVSTVLGHIRHFQADGTLWKLWSWFESNQIESFEVFVIHIKICAMCSVVLDFVTPETLVRQAPPTMGFPRKEYWSGLPFPPLGDLPHSGKERNASCVSCMAGGFFTCWAMGSPIKIYIFKKNHLEEIIIVNLYWTFNVCQALCSWLFLDSLIVYSNSPMNHYRLHFTDEQTEAEAHGVLRSGHS